MVDAVGQILSEVKVWSEREALVTFFAESGLRFTRIGLEAGPLSQWLHAALVEAGIAAILIETRHVKAALAMMVKTDRNDARGMALPGDSSGIESRWFCARVLDTWWPRADGLSLPS